MSNKVLFRSRTNGPMIQPSVGQPERERDIYACLRPCGNIHACVSETHVSCTFPCSKRHKQCQLIVAGIQTCVRYAYATRFRLRQTHKTLLALRTQTVLFSILFVYRNGDMRACVSETMMKSILLRRAPS